VSHFEWGTTGRLASEAVHPALDRDRDRTWLNRLCARSKTAVVATLTCSLKYHSNIIRNRQTAFPFAGAVRFGRAQVFGCGDAYQANCRSRSTSTPSKLLRLRNSRATFSGPRPRAHSAMIFASPIGKRLGLARLAIVFPMSTAKFFIPHASRPRILSTLHIIPHDARAWRRREIRLQDRVLSAIGIPSRGGPGGRFSEQEAKGRVNNSVR